MYPVGGDLFWKSSGRLADGREIIYYDESPGLGRAGVPDRRPLAYVDDASPPGESGLRWDALAGRECVPSGPTLWLLLARGSDPRTPGRDRA